MLPYNLYSISTPKHSKPFLLENYVSIIALAADLRTVHLII
jgi:hypothetical protein